MDKVSATMRVLSGRIRSGYLRKFWNESTENGLSVCKFPSGAGMKDYVKCTDLMKITTTGYGSVLVCGIFSERDGAARREGRKRPEADRLLSVSGQNHSRKRRRCMREAVKQNGDLSAGERRRLKSKGQFESQTVERKRRLKRYSPLFFF